MQIIIKEELYMAQASRTKSHIQEQMEDNSILTLWTQKWGLIVRPAYGIDKLRFSFIQKGVQGKGDSFDIYMECQRDGANCFDDWAYDILHDRRLERILAEEKKNGEKYAKYFNYTTGESGNKHIGITNSMNGNKYVITASIMDKSGQRKSANIPVSFHDLRHLAERYLISYRTRIKQLEGIRISSEKKMTEERAEYRNSHTQTAGNVSVSGSVSYSGNIPTRTAGTTGSNADNATAANVAASVNNKQSAPLPVEDFVVNIKSDFKKNGDMTYSMANLPDGRTIYLIMTQQTVDKFGDQWSKFEKESIGKKYRVRGQMKNNQLLFSSFAR